MPPVGATVSLQELANLAIGTPEVGAVNFNALHTLLVALLKNLNMQDLRVDYHQPLSPERRLSDTLRVWPATPLLSTSSPQVSVSKEKEKRKASLPRVPSMVLESQMKGLGGQVQDLDRQVQGLGVQVQDLDRQLRNMDNQLQGVLSHIQYFTSLVSGPDVETSEWLEEQAKAYVLAEGVGAERSASTEPGAFITEEGAPVSETGAPTTQKGAPTTQKGAPTTQKVAPTTQKGTPTTQRGAPTTEGGAPTTEGGAPITEGAVLMTEEGVLMTEEGVLITEEGAPITQEGAPITQEGALGAFKTEEGVLMTKEGVLLTEEGAPITERGASITERGAPISEGGVPISERGAPTTQRSAPISERGAPTTQRGAPTTQRGAPISERGVPTTQRGAPISERGVPTTQRGAPISERVALPKAKPVPGTGKAVPDMGKGKPETAKSPMGMAMPMQRLVSPAPGVAPPIPGMAVPAPEMGKLMPEKMRALVKWWKEGPQVMEMLHNVMEQVKILKEAQEKAHEATEFDPMGLLHRLEEVEKIVKNREVFLEPFSRKMSLLPPGEEVTMVTWEELEQAITDGWKATQVGIDTTPAILKRKVKPTVTSTSSTGYPGADQAPDLAGGVGSELGPSGLRQPSDRELHHPPSPRLREADRHRLREWPSFTRLRRIKQDAHPGLAPQDLPRDRHHLMPPDARGGMTPIPGQVMYERPDQLGPGPPGLGQLEFQPPSVYSYGFPFSTGQLGMMPPGMEEQVLVQHDMVPMWVPGMGQQGLELPSRAQPTVIPPSTLQYGMRFPGPDQRAMERPAMDERPVGVRPGGMDQPGFPTSDMDQQVLVPSFKDQEGFVQPSLEPPVFMQPAAPQFDVLPLGAIRPGLVPLGMDQPGLVPSGVGQPGLVPPGAGQPGLDQPGMDQPGLVSPGAGQPGLVPPGEGQPALVPPGEGQPGLVPPGEGQPALVPPGEGQPGLVQPGAGQPGFFPPVAGQPIFFPPGAGQPGFFPPGTGQPGLVQTGKYPPGFVQPGAYPYSFAQPGVYPHGLVQPGAYPQGFMRPDVAGQPGLVPSGTGQPGADQPDFVQRETDQYGLVQPGAGQPGVVQPGMDQRGSVQPGEGQPGVVQPGVDQRHLVQRGAYPPGFVQPGAYPPGLVQPGAYPPHDWMQARVYPRALVQPSAYPRGLLQPDIDQQGLVPPGAAQEVQPGVDQPGLRQPGADQVPPGAQPQGFPPQYQHGVAPPGRDQRIRASPHLSRQGWMSPGTDQEGLAPTDTYPRGIVPRGPEPLITGVSARPDQQHWPSPDLDHAGADYRDQASFLQDPRGPYPGPYGPRYPGMDQHVQARLDPHKRRARTPTTLGPEQSVDSDSASLQVSREPSYIEPQRHDSLENVAPNFPIAIETFRLMGELVSLYSELKENMKTLDTEKAGESDLEKIQYLLALMVQRTIPPDLQEQLKSIKTLTKEVRQEKAKMDKLQKFLEGEGQTEMGREVAAGPLGLQLGLLRVSVNDIEKELAELRESQELGKVYMEHSVSEASLYLQDQLDKLRTIIENMLASSSTLLTMSMSPKRASVSMSPGQIDPKATCPACSLDLSHQVSTLVQRYEQLQHMVTSLAASRPSKKAKLQRQDEELLGHVQSAILQVQGDCEKLNSVTGNLIEDHRQKQKDIDVLYQGLEKLEKEKANRGHLEMEIEVKADKSALEGKVSRVQFDATTEQLNHMMQELVAKMSGQEQDWQKMLDQLLSEMDSKLDRLELDPVKQMLEDRWKSLRQQLKERSPLYQADEAAGMRRQLLAHFHCLSCDRPLETTVTGQVLPTTPVGPSMPGHRSTRPYTVFELEQVRQQSRNLKLGHSAFPRADLASMERSVGRLRTMHSKMLMDIEKVQMHYGGSVKASSQMIHELLQAQCLGSPCCKRVSEMSAFSFTTVSRHCGGSHTLTYPYRRTRLQHLQQGLFPEDAQIARKHHEVDILGLDGHIYKGRMDMRLPGIPTKDSAGNNKHKIKPSRSHTLRQLDSSQLPLRPQSAHMAAGSISATSRQHTDRPVSSEGRLSQPTMAHLPSPGGMAMHMDVPPGEGMEEPTRGPRTPNTR
uniref:Glutamine rich 2 n=1 Tax=Pipistrellus kuhlii TaxID=59472 RepID=A0A7J7SEV6_PIPKU|nr:glutamine rich 2 [Pipistrellus kuhlii]